MYKFIALLFLLGNTVGCVGYTLARQSVEAELHVPKRFVKNTRSGTYHCVWYYGREYCKPIGQ